MNVNNTEQQAVGGEEAFSSVIQEIGDICHESYTGCQMTDRPIKEYDYCYTDEIINLLDNPRVKAAISRHYTPNDEVEETLTTLLAQAERKMYPNGIEEDIAMELAIFKARNLDSGTKTKNEKS